ncbi:MAG: cation transporter [Planctomycetes bacterium RBG_16_64_12]|nr:MAG: cation transporter [Planctomycetes bacterium RBG_16_64_12]
MESRASLQASEVRRVTWWGLAVNLALTGVKFLFGVVGSSQALVADAVHTLSDSFTDLAVLIGAGFWSAPADADHPYGHGRIETLITCVIGIVLAGVGVGLAYRAAWSVHEVHAAVPGWSVFAVACLSIAAKEMLYRWTANVGKRLKSSAMVANAWHHRSDALSSVPVAIAVLGTQIWRTWGFLDHIGAVIVSVFILHAAWKILWPALRELIDAGAAQHDREAMLELALHTEGVRAVHKLRTRYIGPGLQVDLHVLVEPELSVREGHAIANVVKGRLLDEGPNVIDVLVHVEPHEPDHQGSEIRGGIRA